MRLKFLLLMTLPLLVTPDARAETATFFFAPVGQSYSAFLAPDDPLVGQTIIATRIFLNVESFAGSDAANFFTDISFPIEPLPGNESALVLTGEELNWSGAGVFNFFESTERFNGTFISRRYGAETPPIDFQGRILDGSRIEFDYVPEPSSLLLMLAGLAATRRRRGTHQESVRRVALRSSLRN